MCEGCHKPSFNYSRGQQVPSRAELSTMSPMGVSSATPPSEAGRPTVATDCPSGALPPHLLCDSTPYIDRRGDHTTLYSGIPTAITLLDLHSNGAMLSHLRPPPVAPPHPAAPRQMSPLCGA